VGGAQIIIDQSDKMAGQRTKLRKKKSKQPRKPVVVQPKVNGIALIALKE
jgi:hypothetical protein